jgi:hypothetical protein
MDTIRNRNYLANSYLNSERKMMEINLCNADAAVMCIRKKFMEGRAMVTSIISLLAVMTLALIAGAFISALMQLDDIDRESEGQVNDAIFADWDDGTVITIPDAC